MPDATAREPAGSQQDAGDGSHGDQRHDQSDQEPPPQAHAALLAPCRTRPAVAEQVVTHVIE